MTSSIITTTGAITITGISAPSASTTYRAAVTVNGVVTNFDKIFTLNKSNNGLKGEGTTQIYIRSTSQPSTPAASAGVPGPSPQWYNTVAGATGTDPLWTSFGTRSAGSNIYTWQTPVRVEGTTVINPPLKNATGYLYFGTATTDANKPPPPQVPQNSTSYNFASGTFGTITANWSTTFSVAPASATLKMWAVRYSVQETVSGGAQTVSISEVFTHQNFNGLVTFTNENYTTNTQVDGKITTATSNLVTGTQVDGKITTATSNLVTGTQVDNKIANATSNFVTNQAVSTAAFANSISTNMTSIDGGKINTGFIAAERLQIGKNNPNNDGNFIRMFDNKIVVYTGIHARFFIVNLS
jgi:hypothetical protein